MSKVIEADVVHVVGPTTEFVLREILRTGASVSELRSAAFFVSSEAGRDPRAYAALAPRMRRLVDLVAVAGVATEAAERAA